MWDEKEMADAFSRRIVRDLPCMPKQMVIGFYIADLVQSGRLYLTMLCMLMMTAQSLSIIYKAIFAINTVLISQNPMMDSLIAVGVVLISYWLVSVAFNLMIMSWHYRARKSFRSA